MAIRNPKHTLAFAVVGCLSVSAILAAEYRGALADGTAHRRTVIVPEGLAVDDELVEVGTLTRREVDQHVVAYSFALRTNAIATTNVPNSSAGYEHVFKAYRVAGDPADAMTLRARRCVLAVLNADEAADDEDEA